MTFKKLTTILFAMVSLMTACSASRIISPDVASDRTQENIEVEGNMIPGFDDESWYSWAQRKEIAPEFTRKSRGAQAILKIDSKGKFSNFGKWLCDVKGIQGGATYKFYVEYLPEKITDESLNVYAMLTWKGFDGKPITRDYVVDTSVLKDNWKSLSRTIDAPNKARSLTVELALKWTDSGSVQWRNPKLLKVEPIKHRKIKVATTHIVAAQNLAGNLEKMTEMLDMVGKGASPDIVCLSESIYDFGVDLPLEQKAQTIPGEVTDAIAQKARQYNMYVIFTMLEKDGGQYHQTAVLIGRDGQIAGKYRKTHLTTIEAELGITPGNEYPVFETDFGKIGIMICWDGFFPEVARILRLNGAEIIFFPTQGLVPNQTEIRAADNGVYIVESAFQDPAFSKIIDPMGQVCAFVKGEHDYTAIEIDLDRRYYTEWLSVGASKGEGKSIYVKERRPSTYGPLK